MSMDQQADGGPVFPTRWTNDSDFNATAPNDDVVPPGGSVMLPGISKRELFAAILMHSEAVTCGVPGEACEALVEASRAAGTDVIDHMALNAVQGADALLRALSEPKPSQCRSLYFSEQCRLDAADRLASAVEAVKKVSEYEALPAPLRETLERALQDVTDPEIPF